MYSYKKSKNLIYLEKVTGQNYLTSIV